MFLKPFKIKSKTAIKGSDRINSESISVFLASSYITMSKKYRKKLRSEVGRQYTNLLPDELSAVIPNKEEMTVMKIMTHSSYNTTVYCLQKNPIFFEIEKCIYPTVYLMWRFPDLLPSFTTWPDVFTKLVGGADLMLPGVIVRGNVSPAALGNLRKGDACSVILRGNRAPVAVGQSALSSIDMVEAAMRGKGVKILHTYRDQLWAVGDTSELPLLAMPPDLTCDTGDTPDDTDSDSKQSDNEQDESVTPEKLGDTAVDDTEPGCCGQEMTDAGDSMEELVAGLSLGGEEGEEGREEDETPESAEDMLERRGHMDSLLLECFLSALKSQVKREDLPLLTSKLLKVYMQPFCPHGERLDVKKSNYKKMSAFMKAMQEKGLVNVKQMTKGVDSIVKVSRDSDMLRQFKVLERVATDEEAGDVGQGQGYRPPQVTEMYIVTAAAQPVFTACGHRKGQAFTQQQVRQILTDYVRENELRTDRGVVTLDPVLSDVVLTKGEYIDALPWEGVFSRCMGRMTSAYQIAFPGQRPVLKKGQVNPIKLTIAQRASSKKVTLVHNLETFGINPEEFAHDVQVHMACSSSVSPLPGKSQGVEVLIQGNQINYIATVLIDKYHLPRKFIQGLEKAPKPGKKKR